MLRRLKYTCILAGFFFSALAQQTKDNLASLLSQLSEHKEDTLKVDLFLSVSEHYFLNPAGNAKYLDSALSYVLAAERLAKSLHYERGTGKSYEQLSQILHVQNNTARARQFADKAIAIFKQNNFFLELGFAYYDLSGYYSINTTEDLTERIRIVEQLALPAFQKSGNKLKEADILKELGDLLQLIGNYTKALVVLNQSLQLYRSLDYKKLHDIYNLMGAVYSVTGNNELALQYGLLAVDAAEKNNDTTIQLASIFKRIGSTYRRMKKLDAAYLYFQKGLVVAKKYGNNEVIVLLASEISRTLVALNKPYEALIVLKEASPKCPPNDIYSQLYITASFLIAYEALQQYDEAQKYCNRLLAISAKLDKYEPDQSEAQYPVTEFYLATHQYDLARKHLAQTDTFYKAIQSRLELNYNHLLWFKLDSIQGNHLSAIKHYQQYKTLSDTLLNETTSKHIEQLQAAYESEKKDNNIKLLENAGKLQESRLAHANQTRNWFLGVAVLLLIITGLLINNVRVKHLSNSKLKVQQKEIEKKNSTLLRLVNEKEWLVKEIHHRVKNNFHTVAGLLATQSQYLITDEAIAAMDESRHRVHAMSLIHQKLYQSDTLSAISMPAYIHELADYLRDSFNIGQSIQFVLRIEPVALALSYCVPLGLILNEAITNSIKYAFPDNSRNGMIEISLKSIQVNLLRLTISDNGIGLPANVDMRNPVSMGLKLMQGLSEDIDGSFNINGCKGTTITVEFTYDS
ncbi:histidine kinase dimerization/phosphoacceptor domain -containing protein [Chitinophaga sp.]|uniref:tetratricopeptide repeat-containing sensor histidine kinase n=1 Tax=Chitinophaga sp. TaxID=1869181 RepID=UPI0031D3EB90